MEQHRRWVERYELEEPNLSVSTPTSEVFLHRQRGTGAIYCIDIAPFSGALSSVTSGVGWMTGDNLRYIYGSLLPNAVSVEVILAGTASQIVHPVDNTFLVVVPLQAPVTLTFKNFENQEVERLQLPSWQPPTISRAIRFRSFIRRLGQQVGLLPVTTDNTMIRLNNEDSKGG